MPATVQFLGSRTACPESPLAQILNCITLIISTCSRFLFAAAGNTVAALVLVLAVVVTFCWWLVVNKTCNVRVTIVAVEK